VSAETMRVNIAEPDLGSKTSSLHISRATLPLPVADAGRPLDNDVVGLGFGPNGDFVAVGIHGRGDLAHVREDQAPLAGLSTNTRL
jgi:hypothetical protein